MKIAILVDDTNLSDMNYHVMSEINNRIGGEHDIFLLTDNISSKVIQSDFSIMNSSKISCVYDGVAIATTFNTAKALIKASVNSKKVYYIYSLEWLYSLSDYEEIFNVLNNPSLTVIVRSENHAKLLENNYNRIPDGIIQNFDLESIWNSLENIKID